MRVEFISENGGRMFVDESRKDEYLRRGFSLASDVVDSTFVEDKPKPKRTAKKKEE